MDSQLILQLAKSRDGLVFPKPIISRSTKPENLVKLLEKAEKPVNRFQLVSNCLVTKSANDSLSEDQKKANVKLTELVAELEREIFLSAIDNNLMMLFEGEYFNVDVTIEQMKSNLKEIIGVPDSKDEEKRQLEDFNSMSRRTEIDETFSSYLNRLKTKAALLTKDSYADKLVEFQFGKMLREMDQSALDFHTLDQSGIALLDKQAELLDKMKMFRKKEVKVNSLQDDVTILDSKLTEFRNELRQESKQQYEQLLEDIGAKLNQLNVQKSEPKSEKRDPPANANQKANTNKKAPKKKKFNKDDYCWVCGLRGHNNMDCKGRPDMVCILCDQPGHVASSRKFHGQPKN